MMGEPSPPIPEMGETIAVGLSVGGRKHCPYVKDRCSLKHSTLPRSHGKSLAIFSLIDAEPVSG